MTLALTQHVVADGRDSIASGSSVNAPQVKETPVVLDDQNAKAWNYLVANFDSDTIDQLLVKFDGDAMAIVQYLADSAPSNEGEPRGPGGNDDCATAIAVVIGASNLGTNIGFLDDTTPPACGVSTPNQGVWYSVVGNGNNLTASTCYAGTTFDTLVEVFCDNCTTPVCVGGNDTGTSALPDFDCTGDRSRFSWCSANGTTYYIRVSGWSASTGNFDFRVTDNGTSCATPPSCVPPTGRCCYNDAGVGTCAITTQAACALLSGVWTTGITDCVASPCPTGRCCYNDGGNVGCVIVMQPVCKSLAGTWTSGITDCVASPCPVGRCCYNDGASCVNTLASICTTLAGSFSSTLTCATACPVAPANNACANAITITNGTTPFNLANATTDGPNEPSCAFPSGGTNQNMNQDIWYHYTATCTGNLFVNTCGASTTDTRIAIYLGDSCPPASTPIQCNDDHANATENDMGTPCPAGLEASLQIPVTQGQIYTIRVGAFSTSGTISGADQLNVDCVAPGACCLPDTSCQDVASLAACTTLGGVFGGNGSACATTNCTTGACCHADGTCTDGALQSECLEVDDVFSAGATCAATQCSGRCCYLEFGFLESCAETNLAACNSLGGDWTADLNCTTDPCPLGKCCNDPGTGPQCDNYTEGHCDFVGGVWTAGVSCQPGDCLPAANDTCETAIPVGCGSVVNGDLTTAANDYDPAVPGPSCTSFAAIGPDIVYSFTSPIARNVTVLMDPSPEFDASLYVVTDCTNVTGTCVAGADDNVLTPGDETLTFAAAANVTYYIVCDKFGTLAAGFGPFTLTVTCPIDPCNSCPADMDGNGRLDGRDVQVFTDCFTQTVNGIPPDGCGCADVDGDADVDIDDVDDFAAALTDILNKFCGDGEGRCCLDNGASCVDGVTVYECNDLGGTFAAGLDCTTECPSLSDDCVDAIAVGIPSSTLGDTTLATADPTAPTCVTAITAPGVWYSVIGTGNTITATTCNAVTGYDSKLNIYCGPCDGLICVTGNDDNCAAFALRSTVTWCSAVGQQYWILVQGFGGQVGVFQLDLSDDGLTCPTPASCVPPVGRCCTDGGNTCTDNTQSECNGLGGVWASGLNCAANPCPVVPPNDVCAGAIAINCDDFVNGNIAAATNDYNLPAAGCTGYESLGPDVVYSLTLPADAVVTLDYVPLAPTYDASIYVVTDCSNLATCVGGSDNNPGAGPESLTFGATASVTYYIICDKWGTGIAVGAGAFTLAVTCDTSGGGACCGPNGTCTEVGGAALCPEGSSYSPGETCAEVVCDSCVNCTDTEGEACGADPDVTNGGCNSTPAVFSTIACGETVCGTSGTFTTALGDTRDTDWWQITLPTATILNWNVQADFAVLVGIIDGNAGCPVTAFLTSATADACVPVGVSQTLTAGTYYLFVGPSDFVGFDCADGPWTYTATALCTPIGDEGACCTAGVCTDGISSATCTGGGGTFQGLGTTCFDVTCPGPEDSCAGAIAITALPYNAAGTTVGYTNDYDSVCPFSGSTSPDVAYSYTPAANETITVDLCGSGYDTKVYIYANTCAEPAFACNDDACGVCGGGAYCSQIVSAALTGGTTYYIIVDGYGGASGTYNLIVSNP